MKHAIKVLVLFIFALTASCAAHQEQLVSPGGVVIIQNDSGEQIEVFVDGSRFAVVEPGARVDLDKIISGKRLLMARGVDSGLSRAREFDLTVGDPGTWRIAVFGTAGAADQTGPKPCSVDIVNNLGSSIDVTVDSVSRGIVPGGSTLRVSGLDAGIAHAVATATDNGAVFTADLIVRPGVVPAFNVSVSGGAARIANRSGRDAMVASADHSPRLVPDGQSVVFDGLAGGVAEFAATDMANRPLAGFRFDAVPGQVTDLVINRPAGTLKVVSDLDRDVSVYADGILVGTCAARGGATIQGLVPGRNHLRAVDSNGDTVASTWTEVGSEPALWLLSAGGTSNLREGMGAIKVDNPSREQVSVFIDGFPMEPVAAGGNRVYPDQLPGEHQVIVIGFESKAFATASVQVSEARTLVFQATLPGASLAVRNSAVEPVNVYADGRHIGMVDAGATGVFPVPEGPRRIDISSASGASSITRNISLPARAVTTIAFSSQYVTVVVTNQFTDPVEVRIDERILGVLNPGERVTVSDVRPGAIRLTATSTVRPVSATTTVSLEAGDAFDWFVNP